MLRRDDGRASRIRGGGFLREFSFKRVPAMIEHIGSAFQFSGVTRVNVEQQQFFHFHRPLPHEFVQRETRCLIAVRNHPSSQPTVNRMIGLQSANQFVMVIGGKFSAKVLPVDYVVVQAVTGQDVIKTGQL